MFFYLLALFIIVPLVELALLIKLDSYIGLPWTLATIVITGFLGASLARFQGMRALSRFQGAMGEGRLPHREVLDGVLILMAGAVLLTPGLLTDVFGFLLLTPPFRNWLRGRLRGYLKGRVHIQTSGTMSPGGSGGATRGPGGAGGGAPAGDGPVIDAEFTVRDSTSGDTSR